MNLSLSVIIPVFNEVTTLEEIIRRVRLTKLVDEIIVVDDGSTDESMNVLMKLQLIDQPPLTILQHTQNQGKGAAMRTGLAAVTSDLVLVQDADLEYNPVDYPNLLKPFENSKTDVVYGSRNLKRNPKSSLSFYWGGRLLSWITNLLYGSHITDEATGYKVIKTALLRDVGVDTDGFEFCPEITAKLLQRGVIINEVPISYQPRSREEGKKIHWFDGVTAIWTLVKYRFFKQHTPEKLTSRKKDTSSLKVD